MPSATICLQPKNASLYVKIHFNSTEIDQAKLEHVVLDHLIRMGQEELTATWHTIQS